jgi:hypothetical protein
MATQSLPTMATRAPPLMSKGEPWGRLAWFVKGEAEGADHCGLIGEWDGWSERGEACVRSSRASGKVALSVLDGIEVIAWCRGWK